MKTTLFTFPTPDYLAGNVQAATEPGNVRHKRALDAPAAVKRELAAAPSGLSKNSASWVSFQHGVNLAEGIEPGSSKRMTQQELIALPGKMSATAVTPEQALFIAAARVGPALEWAVANGILERKTEYSQADIQKAVAALDKHLEEIADAVNSLSTPMPMRKDYFIGTQQVSPIKGHADPDNKTYPVALYDDKRFGEDFKTDLANKKTAYATILQEVFSTLPVPDQIAIAQGDVGVYAMKSSGTDGKLERRTFLLKAVHQGKTRVYEVNPEQGTVVKRDDYIGVFQGSSVIGKKRLPDGGYSETFTAWQKPNIQGSQYQAKVDKQPGVQPDNTSFSAQLYALEPLGELPAPAAGATTQSNSQALFLERNKQLSTLVGEKLFYLSDLDLLHSAQEDPERVTDAEKDDRKNYQAFKQEREKRREVLKGFVPLWHGIEAISAGRPIEGLAQIWIDILSFLLPVEKVVTEVVTSGIRLVKPVIPKFLKPSTHFASYTFRPGAPGVAWEGGVQGLKWAPNTSQNLAKGVNQFKFNATPLSKAGSGMREIEYNGARYFAGAKPDAGDNVHYLLRVPDPQDPTRLVSSGIIAKPDETGVWARRGVQGGERPGAKKTQATDASSKGRLQAPGNTAASQKLVNHPNWQSVVDSGTYNGQPVYIHYTNKEGAEAITRQLSINDASREATRAGSKGGVYVNPPGQQFNGENVETLLFLGNKRYEGRGDYMVIFSTDQVPTNLGPVTAGSPFVELKFPKGIKLTSANFLYAGPNTFPNYFG
ncbi:hypothetical protein MJP36_16795 [Pseudomonas palleroniana]|uniref:hypothetical protein n=1 Tax=Pseudomonas palleroniana TaxID=191390 RepID=UPI001FCB2F57|nr:hypothetical protein [Pseudomonas palleroniana]UOK36171.1 hypothetical protein MJP36_16795 [Pseudomonas palleroniana]